MEAFDWWSDAHAHPGSGAEQGQRVRDGVFTLLCAGDPETAKKLLSAPMKQARWCVPTCGVHPWQADKIALADMEPYMAAAPVVGEIGMDSLWCAVPLKTQEEAFRRQLAFAAQAGKSVILHTKGQEKEIAAILPEYPNRYLVHWYSCGEHLENYLALDCYFSVGPDVFWNPAVRRVAQTVPLDRLLVETDGMAAVAWAWEQAPGEKKRPPDSPKAALWATLQSLAALRGLPLETLGEITKANLLRFLGKE